MTTFHFQYNILASSWLMIDDDCDAESDDDK